MRYEEELVSEATMSADSVVLSCSGFAMGEHGSVTIFISGDISLLVEYMAS
jgi:hypothetical protein